MKSGSLKVLEHSGPVQACMGIALPFVGGRKGSTEVSITNEEIDHYVLNGNYISTCTFS